MTNPSVANTYEPPAKHNENPILWEQVIADYTTSNYNDEQTHRIKELMQQRNQFGIEKHGTPLQCYNGRNPLNDLIQEMLDSVVYCKQSIEEGKDVDGNLRSVYWRLIDCLEVIEMVKMENDSK